MFGCSLAKMKSLLDLIPRDNSYCVSALRIEVYKRYRIRLLYYRDVITNFKTTRHFNYKNHKQ
jgi:hypothetical protein